MEVSLLWGVIAVAVHLARGEALDHPYEAAELYHDAGKVIGQLPQPSSDVWTVSYHKALASGVPGALAGALQVILLMWLRTTMNYQYRYGLPMRQAMVHLYKQGGVHRFYEGLPFALIQGPAARFGSVASNEGVRSLLGGLAFSRNLPMPVVTAVASICAGAFRLVLMPIDVCKVVLQVEGQEGFKSLVRRVRGGQISALYAGAWATCIMTVVTHYPWFVVHTFLEGYLAKPSSVGGNALRDALIGFAATAASDTCSNFLRVLRTTVQVSASCSSMTYLQAMKLILAADGWKGLLGRGLVTRIVGNGLQGLMFNVLWKWLKECDILGLGHATHAPGVEDVVGRKDDAGTEFRHLRGHGA